jgi:hypothetical protein
MPPWGVLIGASLSSLGVVAAGDQSGVVSESDHAQRMDWIETVNEVEKLGVKTIIAGTPTPRPRTTTPHA